MWSSHWYCLGSGIVMNGELVYGHDGFAGEVGHTTIEPFGRDHSTQRKGSLELMYLPQESSVQPSTYWQIVCMTAECVNSLMKS